MMILTNDELNEIWRRWERATPGEWISMYDDESTGPIVAVVHDYGGKEESSVEVALTPHGDDRENDFDFIASVHQDIPRLKAHIEQLTAENQRLAAQVQRWQVLAAGDFMDSTDKPQEVAAGQLEPL